MFSFVKLEMSFACIKFGNNPNQVQNIKQKCKINH
jgi:hypothetical protein